MKKRYKWAKADKETVVFLFFLSGMAVYYGWRMFALTPWYDELYTYYYFISRGPVYAAIHWPLPNNHVGYSVLSAVLDLFGSSAVGLRGISFLASLGSLILLYRIGRQCFPHGFALLPPCLFSSMDLVNQMAVQGRGYALASFLCLTAFWALWKLVSDSACRAGYYVMFGASLVWALYTLASSVYFVIPLCMAGGLTLLCGRRFRELARLVCVSLVSALCTVLLYSVIWLAIGSNLLTKTEGSGWFGEDHIDIILHAPFAALRTGIDYMLATPYIQSVARNGYLSRFRIYVYQLFERYYGGCGAALMVIVLLGLGAVVYRLAVSRSGLMEWYLLTAFTVTPLMLVIQAALPYYRVFSYLGAAAALMCTWLVTRAAALLCKNRADRTAGYAAAACSAAGLALVAGTLFLPPETTPYGVRETAIEEAYRAVDVTRYDKIAVTDCDQQYLLKYLYGLDMDNDRDGRLTTNIEEADCVLLDRQLLLSEREAMALDIDLDTWRLYTRREDVPHEYLEEQMRTAYENEMFVLYTRR